MKKVLIVGGAGYIGSHCVLEMHNAGYEVTVLDNLIYGHKESLPTEVTFIEGDISDYDLVVDLLEKNKIELVMHFAAFAYVGESMAEPLKYYQNNVENTIVLLRAMQSVGVKQLVFSSSCATYGVPEKLPIIETTPQTPINPYGETKLVIEKLLKSLSENDALSVIALRYFNAAGASGEREIGEDHDPELHLIPLVIKATQENDFTFRVFGDDYDTSDGTCERDYIHVSDVAMAHLMAAEKLNNNTGGFSVYNLGAGTPASVKNIINLVSEVSKREVRHTIEPRRAGDPPSLYTDYSKAKNELGWEPKNSDLATIIQSAYTWHTNNPNGYQSS